MVRCSQPARRATTPAVEWRLGSTRAAPRSGFASELATLRRLAEAFVDDVDTHELGGLARVHTQLGAQPSRRAHGPVAARVEIDADEPTHQNHVTRRSERTAGSECGRDQSSPQIGRAAGRNNGAAAPDEDWHEVEKKAERKLKLAVRRWADEPTEGESIARSTRTPPS